MNKKKLHLQKMVAIAGGMPRYVRKGKCNQCGQCCLNEKCDHLFLKQSDGKYYCRIYNSKDRPRKCKLFPANPPIIFENCGYYFIDKVDNRRLGYKEI